MNIAIFASGTGSNARKIIEHFQSNGKAKVALVVSNKADAPVLGMAAQFGIPVFTIASKADFQNPISLLQVLLEKRANMIVLAGFLWLIPHALLSAYEGRIINIHPSLLPRFGGKGMYGMSVHRAVCESGARESGISIHRVNARYDEGDILLQARCRVAATDTPDTVAQRVQQLEHRYFPGLIEALAVMDTAELVKTATY
jgi:phosphoribosylglycinamide formyltransferase-1